MLKWLATRAYNRFDPVWIVMTGLALRDRNYLAALIASVVGVALSAVIEFVNGGRDTDQEKTKPQRLPGSHV